MAVEFGAKLYLKDNMYATLKKNLGLQREFSEQVDKTNASMQQMGRTRVNAIDFSENIPYSENRLAKHLSVGCLASPVKEKTM